MDVYLMIHRKLSFFFLFSYKYFFYKRQKKKKFECNKYGSERNYNKSKVLSIIQDYLHFSLIYRLFFQGLSSVSNTFCQ